MTPAATAELVEQVLEIADALKDQFNAAKPMLVQSFRAIEAAVEFDDTVGQDPEVRRILQKIARSLDHLQGISMSEQPGQAALPFTQMESFSADDAASIPATNEAAQDVLNELRADTNALEHHLTKSDCKNQYLIETVGFFKKHLLTMEGFVLVVSAVLVLDIVLSKK
jgi:hypothetical protein